MHGEAAAAIIMKENVNVKAGIVKEGTLVATDFLCDRVRVWVDSYGIVGMVPIIGLEAYMITKLSLIKNACMGFNTFLGKYIYFSCWCFANQSVNLCGTCSISYNKMSGVSYLFCLFWCIFC